MRGVACGARSAGVARHTYRETAIVAATRALGPHLTIREPEDAVAGAGKDRVALTVAFERVAVAVVAPAVGLDEHADEDEVEPRCPRRSG